MLIYVHTYAVWKSGVKESTKDPGILSAACEVMFSCLGQQLAIMETASARGLVRKMFFCTCTTYCIVCVCVGGGGGGVHVFGGQA